MAKKRTPKVLSPTEEAIAEITKKYGEGALQEGRGTFVSVEAIPTGIFNVDVITGCGGIPRGRITEIYGNESGGKTTLCLKAMANCQKLGGIAAFVDAEHALDPDWAEANGVDMDKLLIAQPDSGDEALNIVETLVTRKAVDLIVTDSVAALVPQDELDGDVGDTHIGAQARMLSQALRKLVGKAKKSQVAVLFVNQLREKIGVKFGSPEQTPGGRALKFYSSMRMEVKRKGNLIQQKVKVYGMQAGVKIVKNKVAPPFQSTEFEIHFGQPFQLPVPRRGIFIEKTLLQAAVRTGVLDVRGSHYYLGIDSKKSLANGSDAILDKIIEDEDLQTLLAAGVYESLKSHTSKNNSDGEDDDFDMEELE